MPVVPKKQLHAAAQRGRALSRQRRGLRQQGRACVLWGLGLFVLTQAGFRAYIEWHQPELRDPIFENKYRQLARRVAEAPAPPVKVVFFGSSITAHGIDAGRLEGPLSQALKRPAVVFNLGIHSSGPFSQLVYLQRLLDRGQRPDLAVIELTSLVFEASEHCPDVFRFPGQRLEHRELGLVQRYGEDPKLRQAWWQAFLVPIYGDRLAILSNDAPVLLPDDDRLFGWQGMDGHGWLRQEIYKPKRRHKVVQRMLKRLGPGLAQFKAGAPQRQALRELLDLLQREGIATVLLRVPEGPLLQSLYRTAPRDPLLEEFTAVSRHYGFPLVNARDWLGEEQFVDSHHPTWEGAQVLTDRLGRETLVPLLAQRYYALQPSANLHVSRGRP